MIIAEEWIHAPKSERQLHLNLDEECLVRGGESGQHRGVLAQFLNSTIPSGYQIHLCHACNNRLCSNPRHLYWGTASENSYDAVNDGVHSQLGKAWVTNGGRPLSICKDQLAEYIDLGYRRGRI